MLSIFRPSGKDSSPGRRPRETQRSLGLKGLLPDPPEPDGSTLRVLDLGPAHNDNLEFFSRYGAELTVADLYNGFMAQKLATGGNEEVRKARAFSDLLDYGSGTQFDLVLSWDILNYLSPEEQLTLMGSIEPYCMPGTAFLAFICSHKEMPPSPSVYAIQDETTIQFEAPDGRTRPSPRYLEGDLVKQLYALTVENRYQLRNGMLEYVFSYRMGSRVGTASSASRGYRLAPASR